VVNRNAYRQAITSFANLTRMFIWARKHELWCALLIEGDPLTQRPALSLLGRY
jgi:hypothetical protein